MSYCTSSACKEKLRVHIIYKKLAHHWSFVFPHRHNMKREYLYIVRRAEYGDTTIQLQVPQLTRSMTAKCSEVVRYQLLKLL